MLKTSVPYSPNHILPMLAFGASHIQDSIWQGNPERKQIIYLAGKIIVIRQITTQKTTLIKLSDNVKHVHFMGVSPDKKNIIVSETLTNDTSLTLGIYSIADHSKRLFRIIMSDLGNHFRLFDFAENMPNLVLLLTQSNQIYTVDLEKLRHVCYFNLEKFIPSSIKVCIDDSHLISICSRDSVRVYRLQEYTLKPLEAVKGINNYKYTAQLWTTEGLFVGTEEGSILWITYQQGCYQLLSELKIDSSILNISQAGTNKLLSVSDNGFVLLWEADYRNTKYGVGYQIIRTWKLPVGRVTGIRSLLITERLQEIVFGFEDNYIGIVNVADMYDRGPAVQQLDVDYLYKGSNSGGISSTDICIQRPIVVSVSKIDRSVRVYNYRLNRCDLVKYYSEKTDPQIQCVSIHPFGYYLALGFANKLKVLHLLHNELKDYRQLLLKQVDYVKFSESGAHLAVSCSKLSDQVSSWQLIILNSFTLETVYSFIDWNSPIVSVKFCRNDTLLVAMCNGGSLRLCNIGSSVSATKIAPRSTKLHTSMAVYQPTDNIKHAVTLSVFSCSPHLKQGSTLRQCKQVAKKYVQKFYDIRQYNINTVETFYKASTESFRLLAGCVQGIIVLYNIPFDGIPLYVVNAHTSCVSSLIMSPCQSLLFSGCKDGVLLCSELQSWQDVSKTPKAQCLEQNLSDIMLISILGFKDTQDKNKKLMTGINQVEQRSKQVQRDLKGKFQQKLTNIIKQKDEQIQKLKQQFLQHLSEMKRVQQRHKQQVNEIEIKNSQAVSDLEVLFERKIFLQAEHNVKLKHHINNQEQKYKQQLQQLQSIHTENINTLTLQFNQMLNKTATLYRKQTTKQKVSEKGYEQKLKIIDEEYEDQIQRLIQKHNLEEFKKTEIILKLNRETDSLKSTIRGCNDEIVDKNRQIARLKEQIDDLKIISEAKEKDIQELDVLLEEKQTFVTESKNKMSEIRDKFKDTERKRVILNIKAAEWRQAIQPREKEIQKLRNKLYQLQGQLDSLISRQQTHLSTIQSLESQKVRLTKITKQQAISIKSQQNIVSSILMDIKNILDKPKQSNRVYHEEIMSLFRKYNESGDRHLGGNTIQGIGQINRQVMHLERVIDIKNKTSKKAMDQRNLELNKKAVENNQLIRDLNDYKILYKQRGLEIKSKQKIIDDLTNELKQYSMRKTSRPRDKTNDKNTDRTTNHQTKHQTPLSMSRSNSLRVHKISKGSNFQPTLISNQKKEKLVELTSENELMRQYIVKLENKEANMKERIMRHLRVCEAGDRILEQLIS